MRKLKIGTFLLACGLSLSLSAKDDLDLTTHAELISELSTWIEDGSGIRPFVRSLTITKYRKNSFKMEIKLENVFFGGDNFGSSQNNSYEGVALRALFALNKKDGILPTLEVSTVFNVDQRGNWVEPSREHVEFGVQFSKVNDMADFCTPFALNLKNKILTALNSHKISVSHGD